MISPTEFEIILYLNQMGVFNLQEETNAPGCVALKLCEGELCRFDFGDLSPPAWFTDWSADSFLSMCRL